MIEDDIWKIEKMVTNLAEKCGYVEWSDDEWLNEKESYEKHLRMMKSIKELKNITEKLR